MELIGKNVKQWLEQGSKKCACNHGFIEKFSFKFIYITKFKCSLYDDYVSNLLSIKCLKELFV